MATLRKVTTTRWVLPDGTRVQPQTAGAKRIKEKSAKWYIVARVGGKIVRTPAYTDKAASQAKLVEWVKAHERGQAGILDPFRKHLEAPIGQHLDAYLAVLGTTTRDERYRREVKRVISKVVRQTRMTTLRDFTAEAVNDYMLAATSKAATRNGERTKLVVFGNWLVRSKRLPANPLDRFTVQPHKPQEGETKRLRRALPADQLKLLLVAVRDWPLARTRNVAKLRPAWRDMLARRGRERHLVYRTALLTGLRRGELSRLRLQHLDLEAGAIRLPENYTKNSKPAVIPVVPSLLAELRAWAKEQRLKPADRLLTVPDHRNLTRLHRKHLQLAGIPYQDDRGRYADFHSLRMSAAVYLRLAGIPAKERQLFLRHAKLSLTTETYDDEGMTEMKRLFGELAKLDQ